MLASLRRLALFFGALSLALSPLSALSQGFGDSKSSRGYSWVPCDERQPLPPDAVRGGRESSDSTSYYVCRVEYSGGVHPGKVVGKSCNIGYGGKEIVLPRYEVLTGARDGSWGPPRNRLEGAFEAGSEQGRPLFLCRAEYRGGTHPGKVVSGVCNFGWGGREISLSTFEVFYLSPTRRDDRDRDPYPPSYPDQQSSTPFTICADQSVPRGLVVVKAGRDMKCPNWTATGFNTFTVKRPGDTEEICASSPMPRGYVVTSEGLNWDCPNWTATGTNTKKIRRY